jgi:hypothetical protein
LIPFVSVGKIRLNPLKVVIQYSGTVREKNKNYSDFTTAIG